MRVAAEWRDAGAGTDVRGRVTEKAFGQARQLLDMQLVRFAQRIGNRVGNAVVDRSKTGSVWISQVADLYRCDAAGQHPEPMPIGVTRKLDQNIETVLTQHHLQFVVRSAAHGAPILD